MKQRMNWRERVVLMLFHLAHIVESVLFICSLGYISTNLAGKVLFSDWAFNFQGESK
jgi:hypothetical protein